MFNALKYVDEVTNSHSYNKSFSSFQDMKSPAPVIAKQGQKYMVHIHSCPVLSSATNKFSNAVEALMQSFFVYSLEYPKEAEKTMYFLEYYLFNKKSKMPAAVHTWAKKIGMQL